MPNTPRVGILELESGQNGVTVFNTAVRELEAYSGTINVLEADRTSPPGSPADGDMYWVPTGATGAWSGHANEITFYQSASWQFQAPQEGWHIYDREFNELYKWDGAALVLAYRTIYPISIASPTASEDRTIMVTEIRTVIYEVECVLVGATDVTFQLRHGSDRSAAGTAVFSSAQTITNTTTGTLLTSFASATIAANEFLWLETTAVTGPPAEFHVSVRTRRG